MHDDIGINVKMHSDVACNTGNRQNEDFYLHMYHHSLEGNQQSGVQLEKTAGSPLLSTPWLQMPCWWA